MANLFTLFIATANCDQVDVGRLRAFLDQRIVQAQASRLGESVVDEGHIHVGKHAGKLGGFDFTEAEAARVFCDIDRRRFQEGRIVQGDQAFIVHQNQRTTFVRRVVGQRDLCAVRQFINAVVLFRVSADGIHEGVTGNGKVVAAVIHHRLHVGLVLVSVGIQAAIGQCGIRRYVVSELDDFDVQVVLFFGNASGDFHHFGFRTSYGAHFNGTGFRIGNVDGKCKRGQAADNDFLHGVTPVSLCIVVQ